METREINGKMMRRISIPCPDGIKGCAVCHYMYIPVEGKEYRILISFMNKESKTIELRADSNRHALHLAIAHIKGEEKEDVIGTKITYIGD